MPDDAVSTGDASMWSTGLAPPLPVHNIVGDCMCHTSRLKKVVDSLHLSHKTTYSLVTVVAELAEIRGLWKHKGASESLADKEATWSTRVRRSSTQQDSRHALTLTTPMRFNLSGVRQSADAPRKRCGQSESQSASVRPRAATSQSASPRTRIGSQSSGMYVETKVTDPTALIDVSMMARAWPTVAVGTSVDGLSSTTADATNTRLSRVLRPMSPNCGGVQDTSVPAVTPAIAGILERWCNRGGQAGKESFFTKRSEKRDADKAPAERVFRPFTKWASVLKRDGTHDSLTETVSQAFGKGLGRTHGSAFNEGVSAGNTPHRIPGAINDCVSLKSDDAHASPAKTASRACGKGLGRTHGSAFNEGVSAGGTSHRIPDAINDYIGLKSDGAHASPTKTVPRACGKGLERTPASDTPHRIPDAFDDCDSTDNDTDDLTEDEDGDTGSDIVSDTEDDVRYQHRTHQSMVMATTAQRLQRLDLPVCPPEGTTRRAMARPPKLDEVLRDLNPYDSSTMDFLQRVCVLPDWKVAAYRMVFDELQQDQRGGLDPLHMCMGLTAICGHDLKDGEVDFAAEMLDLSGSIKTGGITFEEFVMVAALCENITSLSAHVRAKIDPAALLEKKRMAMLLFFVDAGQDCTMHLDDLVVLLDAGRVSKEQQRPILDRLMAHGGDSITFLEYLAYLPLFLDLHQDIVSNTFNDEHRLF